MLKSAQLLLHHTSRNSHCAHQDSSQHRLQRPGIYTILIMSSSAPPARPPFSSLPLDPAGPPGNAWGLYGKDDRLGALNLLTPAVVAAAAASEIRTGQRVSLDWSLNNPSQPSFDRAPFESRLVNRAHPSGEKRTVNDDILHFNTQCSSQWDGFRHYGTQLKASNK